MIDLIYVLSPGHSGSTLLGLLLGAHPQIATVGELKRMPQAYRTSERCACGAAIDECAFWTAIAARLAQAGLDIHSSAFRIHAAESRCLSDRLLVGQVRGHVVESLRSALSTVWPPVRAHARQTLRCNVETVRAVLEHTGRQAFLDTSKDASRLRYLLAGEPFRVRVLHLVRDGRAVAYSMIRKGLDPVSAARDWVSEHLQAERLRQRVRAQNWLHVSYERLCADTDEVLREVCGFAGLDESRRTLDFRSWDSHVIGNRMRLEKDNRIGLDTTWQSELRGEARRIVESITVRLNRRYGYN